MNWTGPVSGSIVSMVFFLFFLRHILASIESSQCIQCIQWPQFLGSVPSNSRTKMTLAEWDCSLQQHHWWKIHPTARVHCFLVIHALPQKNLAEINSTHSRNFSSSQSWKWNMGLWKMSLSLQKDPKGAMFPSFSTETRIVGVPRVFTTQYVC